MARPTFQFSTPQEQIKFQLNDKHSRFIRQMLDIAQYNVQPTIPYNPHADFKNDTGRYTHPDKIAKFSFRNSIPYSYISVETIFEYITTDPTKWNQQSVCKLQSMGDPYATYIMKGLYLGSVSHIQQDYLSYLGVKYIVSVIESNDLPDMLKAQLTVDTADIAESAKTTDIAESAESADIAESAETAEPAESTAKHAFTVTHIGVRDNGSSDESKNLQVVLDDIVDTLHQRIENGDTCLVHCQFGISRSSTVVAAYLIKYKKFTPTDAIEYMVSLRPQVSPNLSFRILLENYARTL